MRELNLDVSQFQKTAMQLRGLYSEEGFEKMMYAVLRRTGKHVGAVLKKDLRHQYQIKSGDIAQTIQPMQISKGADHGMNCVIPVEGNRGTLGRRTALFKAWGGLPGWRGIVPGKRYKIPIRMIKGGARGVLPEVMAHQGGQPPFINTAAPALNNLVFTRTGKDKPGEKAPIVLVTGIGIPQMPLNRSEDEVRSDIEEFMMRRLEAEHNYRMNQIR